MSKRAAEVMESQARNLRHALVHLHDVMGRLYGMELVDNVAKALEHAAAEEREAGKAWWAEQASKIQHRPRVDGEIQIPPKVEPWW